MHSQQSKENILKKIRQALETSTKKPVPKPDFSASIYTQTNEDPSVTFAQIFTKNKGEFIFCEDEKEFLTNLELLLDKRNLRKVYVWEKALQVLLSKQNIAYSSTDNNFTSAEVGITLCECLIARTGCIMVSSGQMAGRRLGIYPHIHIVVAYSSQLLPDVKDGLQFLQNKYTLSLPSMINMIAGPSRTADIEKTLVLGAHGPKEIILFLIEG
ncbi:hypothetical protein GXP67_15915 [Rhodocytophaga rosea]|uniref:LUD domain-containing protein n=1 Tax=Rhodocytophaga rosea TaxID=2704465 RepID=A0A6C0GIY3_9BACT|nr:LUD domain-containing protein [Rhodocytophaga rosea]QHT68021.1 hypothetical protein GXP67_15915 [Rhodocytophaga rosea]